MIDLPRQPTKIPLSRRILQWLALVPALFILPVRDWLVKSVREDRELKINYQRYLNRR
jgi:hypothetical protein